MKYQRGVIVLTNVLFLGFLICKMLEGVLTTQRVRRNISYQSLFQVWVVTERDEDTSLWFSINLPCEILCVQF